MDLSANSAFVTGGSNGIGKEIALSFASHGSDVFFTYIKDRTSAEQVFHRISSLGVKCGFCQMDVSSRTSVRSALQACLSTLGRLNVLVNNAGINKPTDFDHITDDDWDSVLNVNLKGPFICSQEAIEIMKDFSPGSIINISSVSGQYGGPRTAHYAASKAALISLSQVIARFASQYNIRSNTIAAGLIQSDMASAGMQSPAVQQASQNVILKRFGLASEVAETAAFLASNVSSYITAQTINVNGGLYF